MIDMMVITKKFYNDSYDDDNDSYDDDNDSYDDDNDNYDNEKHTSYYDYNNNVWYDHK